MESRSRDAKKPMPSKKGRKVGPGLELAAVVYGEALLLTRCRHVLQMNVRPLPPDCVVVDTTNIKCILWGPSQGSHSVPTTP